MEVVVRGGRLCVVREERKVWLFPYLFAFTNPTSTGREKVKKKPSVITITNIISHLRIEPSGPFFCFSLSVGELAVVVVGTVSVFITYK